MGKSERAICQFEGNDRPSETVLEAVATVEETEPWNLQPPLYGSLDPDALDSLLMSETPPEQVAFAYLGHDVTVGCDGHVIVE
ncbi:HalOD1 output domain-containing protein [Haladaptatus pallidirubidus]